MMLGSSSQTEVRLGENRYFIIKVKLDVKVAMTYWSLTVSAGILVTLTSQTYIYSSI